MPVLPNTYTAQLGERPGFGGRRAVAEDFSTGLGDAGAMLSRQAKQLMADEEEGEARKALIASAEVKAKYAKLLDEAALSGADTAKLREDMTNELAKVGEGFQTKRGQESLQLHIANSQIMFDQEANAINVRRASAEARLAGQSFLANEGAIVQRNPAYLEQAIKNADAFGETLNRVPAPLRAEIVKGLKQELNQAAAWKAVKDNPEDAKKRLEGGEWDLSPDGRRALLNNADTEIKGQRADKEYQRLEKVRTERAAVDEARGKILDDIIAGKTNWARIRDNPALAGMTTPEGINDAANAKKEMYIFMQHRNNELAGQVKKSDPATKNSLWLRSYGPVGDLPQAYDNKDIVAAVAAGKLNTDDANQLIAVRAGAKNEDGQRFASRLGQRMQVIASSMRASPVYANQPELASNIQIELMRQAEVKSAELRKAGTPPETMFDPDSKDYFFTPKKLNDVANDIKAREQAARPRPLNIPSPEAILTVDNGTVVEANGRVFVVDEASKERVRAALKGATLTPSGETKADWRAATGGVLKPGQNEDQAYAEWLKRKK